MPLLILGGCASTSKAPPLTAPAWEAIPAGVLDALCTRLKMDAIATGAPLALVSTTRPLATSEAIAALGRTGRGRSSADRVATAMADASRTLPVLSAGSSCAWRPVSPSEIPQTRDEMLVEL